MTQEPWLNDIAVALADGRPIDWAAIDARPLTDSERAMAARFRLIERVLQAHVGPDGELSVDLRDSLTSPAPATVAPGQDDVVSGTWGPLTILQRIGRGTYGDVYRAHDTRLDRVVALKLLRRLEPGGDARGSAVIEEGRLLARVQHPNVVTVHGAERIDGRVGLWMEFLEGHTLAEEVRLGGPRSARAIARIGRDLCSALTAVHEAGLLHHDLKAQNVMRTQDGRIVLTDFGAGQDSRGSGNGSGSQPLAGTPAYLAPEVLAGQPATVQSEVYSLGVLLYHLATGTFPVRGRSLQEFRDAHAVGANVELLAARADMPPTLVAAITRCLASAPADRFQTMDELAAALGSAIDAAPAYVVAAGHLAQHTPRRPLFTWRAAGIVLASIALSAAAGFATSYTQPEVFQSTAVIYVTPQQVSTSYVSSDTISVADRVSAIRQRVVSRTKLEALITELDLYPELKGGTMEARVEQMRTDVSIVPAPGQDGAVSDALNVRFVGAEPRTTQKVTDRISDVIINESMRDRENSTAASDQFLESTLEELSRRLSEYEQKLRVTGRGQSPDLLRDYEELQARYRKMFGLREEAKTRANLERRSLGSQFRLLDAARLPDRPISPNRLNYAGVGAFGGFVLGLVALTVRRRPR